MSGAGSKSCAVRCTTPQNIHYRTHKCTTNALSTYASRNVRARSLRIFNDYTRSVRVANSRMPATYTLCTNQHRVNISARALVGRCLLSHESLHTHTLSPPLPATSGAANDINTHGARELPVWCTPAAEAALWAAMCVYRAG